MQGVPGLQVILDDILITGKTDEEHLKNLDMALERLSSCGLRANPEKCEIFQRQSNLLWSYNR